MDNILQEVEITQDKENLNLQQKTSSYGLAILKEEEVVSYNG